MVNSEQNIRRILELARLAPSSHNTQPWKVSLNGSQIIVGYQPGRQLRVGDPDKRELFISLGCFIETAVQAARGLGWQAEYKYQGDRPSEVVRLSLAKTVPADKDLIAPIKNRRSDRRPFLDKPLPAAFKKKLSGLRSGDAKVFLTDQPDEIALLSDVTRDATLKAMSQKEFRAELAGWIRNNWTKKPDGMPAYVQGIPGPISLLAKAIVRENPKVAGSQAKKDAKSVLQSAAIALIVVKNESPEAWLDAGQLYQKVCLSAAAAGIGSAAFSAAVMDGSTTETIKRKLGLSSQPVALIRLGYAKDTSKASPRRTVADILG